MHFSKKLSKSDLYSGIVMLVIAFGILTYVVLRKNGINSKGVYTTGVITGISSEVEGTFT
jgi:uncharacterized membrane protein (DUF4010 family)